MERQKITLQGNSYHGRFSVAQEKGEFCSRGDHYSSDQLYYKYRWRGVGIIENVETREIHRFLLTTQYNEYGREKGLIECLVRIKDEWSDIVPNTRIVDKKSVYDLVLRQMHEDAREREKSEVIPNVSPKKIQYEELLNLGFAIEKSGQARISLQSASHE